MFHLKKLMVEAIKHRGFAYVDVFQPCVSFNYLNTYNWFSQRVYKLEDEGHDVTDRNKALEKAFEWGDRIPIGIFYNQERPTYQDSIPQATEVPPIKVPTGNVNITSALQEFT
jgi:2-oxoglutarate ferredoxin oxidoreductase subunit beta